jgi:HEAT repeat protein
MKLQNSLVAAMVMAALLNNSVPTQAAPVVNPPELIALLKSNAPNSEKVKAFKPLAVFGGKDAVSAIAPYLADEELSSWARIALEAIPDPACDEAFRQAETTLHGRLLIGVINSIGVRRDSQAVGALVKRLSDSDETVAAAAAASLGRIGGEEATSALEKALPGAPPAVRFEAADALVRCAEKNLTEGKKENALRLYELVAKAEVPEQRVLEAIHGEVLAQGPAWQSAFAELLQSSDKKRFGLALKLSREIAAPEVTDALLAEMPQASAARQALLLLALADHADPKGREALLAAAKTGTGEVRIASIRGLKKAGDASCGPVLVEAALDSDAAVSAAAEDVLADLPAKEIDGLIAAQLQSASGTGRLVLIGLAGRRHIETATSLLLKLADDPDKTIRSAALSALGATVRTDELSVLVAKAIDLGKPDDAKAAQAALRAACGRMSDHDATTAAVTAAMTSDPAKCILIDMLVSIGGNKALTVVADAAKDKNAAVRLAAYKALGEWTTVDAGPVLRDLITNGDPDLRINATRAYIRIARQFVIPGEERMAMFHEIMTLAKRDEERKLALDILKQIRTPESLATAVSFLDQKKLTEAAASVAVTLSTKMVATYPSEVATAMTKVLQKAKEKDVVNKARALLNRTGKK